MKNVVTYFSVVAKQAGDQQKISHLIHFLNVRARNDVIKFSSFFVLCRFAA